MNKKRGLKGCCHMIMMLGVFYLLNTITFASTITTVKIGLESIYKDAASISISSQSNVGVGYFEDGYFSLEGTLNTNSIIIKRATEEFYYTGSTYHNLLAAQEAATVYGNGSIAAYVEPGTYCVYTNNYSDTLLKASASLTRIAVYNSFNELVFVSENNQLPLLFQGFDNRSNFPVTQVGNSRQFRGAIGVVNGQSSGITAVNAVGLEDYLYGVVPVEMAPLWPAEALKAQAVAARTLAVFQYSRYASRGYNLVDTTACQVYKGFGVESLSTNSAVDETKGELIKYNNDVAEALYFSTSGGVTEDAKYVWGNEVPYLKNVLDSFETEPAQAPWIRTVTLSEIDNSLASQGINIGRPEGVEITSRTPAGRVQLMTIIGSNGSHVLKNESVRTFFSGMQGGSLKSRLFSFSGFIGTANGSMPNQMITVMSADNIAQKDMSTVSAISSTGLQTLAKNPVVASERNQQVLTAETRSGINVPTQSEIVFGDLTFYGQGFGHGAGMSQSGAKGMAKAGYNYRDILTYYYNGVTIER